jgi:uncharacterized RDD family membrane protein YckC
VFTLGVGWAVWALFTANEGQTPGKKIMGFQMVRDPDGKPADLAWMLFVRGMVGACIAPPIWATTFALFWPFWDDRNRTVWDIMSWTVARKV